MSDYQTAKIIDDNNRVSDLHVKAADWPYTFWHPFLLGDAAWPERYSVARLYRSKTAQWWIRLAEATCKPMLPQSPSERIGGFGRLIGKRAGR